MAKPLFPAVLSVVDNDSGREEDDDASTEAAGLEWLKNKSYSEPNKFVEPSCDDGRKRHKRSFKQSKKPKKEDGSTRVSVLPPKAVWLEEVGLKPEMAYHFDKAPDVDNVRYGGLYSNDIANYRRCTNHCFGLQNEINFTDNRGKKVSKKHSKSGLARYYKGSLSKQQDTTLYTGLKGTVFEWEENYVSFAATEKLKSVESGDANTDSETSEWYIAQRSKAYNQLLAEDPSNVSLWLEFLQFQDEIFLWGCVPGVDSQGGSDSKKQSRLALVERKIAIYEKALHLNPLSVELLIGHMSLCEDTWDHEKLIKAWKGTVFKLPQKAALWVNYILYCQQQFSHFTVTQLSSIYAKCLSTLSSLHEGLLRSHKPEADIEESMVSIVALFCLFLRGAGHTEKAAALYQALVEFNLCCPASLSSSDVSAKEAVAFLEPFWDSGTARIGENGSKGWKSWVERENTDENDFPDLGLVQLTQVWSEGDTPRTASDDEEMELVHEKPLADAWVSMEMFRESQHHLPWKASADSDTDNNDDPDRMVLFDDIAPYLFRLSTEELRLSLIQHFLNFLGVRTSAVASTCCVGNHVMCSLLQASQLAPPTSTAPPTLLKPLHSLHGLIVPTTCCIIGRDFDKLQLGDIKLGTAAEPPNHISVCFIRNFLNQSLSLLSSPSQTVIFRDWLRFELLILNYSTPKEARKKLKCVRKLAKMLLKRDAHRNNMQLWCSYAHLEMICEGRRDAIRVCEKLLTQSPINLDSHTCVPTLEMYLYLIELVFDISSNTESDADSAVSTHIKHILLCIVDGKYQSYTSPNAQIPSTKLLSAQNKLLQTFQRLDKTLSDPTQTANGMSGQHYSLLTSCLLYCTSVVFSLSNAYKLFQEHCVKFIELNISQQHVCHLERVFITMVRLILCSKRLGSCTPQMLRHVLEQSLVLFPSNTYFLECFIESEKRCFVAGRLRRYFDSKAPQCATPITWLYAIRAEWLRYQMLKEHRGDISVDEPTLGIIHRIRSLFYRASQAPNSRCCVLLWRMYMSFEFQYGDEASTSAVFYQAIRLCPGIKVLYLDAARHIPSQLTKIVEMMEEKEIRSRAPVDEVKLLQELSKDKTI